MKLLKYLYLVAIALILNLCQVTAQQETTTVEELVKNDPIVEMLDSLVTLNNVLRFNSQNIYGSGVTTGVSAVPVYSDEIYAQRMAKLYSPIPLVFNDEVKRYIDLYAYKRRSLTSRVMGLSNLYFPLFEEVLDKEGLPLEFKYLAVVESALNPVAVSKMGATGLWQFMYNTGKMYDLKINSYYDERRDPIKSSYAACRYFKDMYAIYGDWLLVIAAYNCGPGNVNKAIKRAGGQKDFWAISKYLPAETRGYVPAFIAVTYVMSYSSEHQIFPIAPAFNYFEVDTVAIDRSLTFRKIAEAIDLPIDVISFLNPIYKKGIIPDTEHSNYLRLPASKISAFIAAESTIYDPIPAPSPVLLASNNSGEEKDVSVNTSQSNDDDFKLVKKKVKKNYIVRSGDNLSLLAKRFNCTVSDLRSWNKLSSNSILKGQKLAYYTTVTVKVPVPEKVATTNQNNSSDSAKASDTANQTDLAVTTTTTTTTASIAANQEIVYHMVQKGDTLWNIAQRYEGATVEQIMKINKIQSSKNLIPGTKLKVKVSG